MEISTDLEGTLGEFSSRLPELRRRLLADPPSGSKMSAAYLTLIQSLLVHA